MTPETSALLTQVEASTKDLSRPGAGSSQTTQTNEP
jgi:hypothetical protein